MNRSPPAKRIERLPAVMARTGLSRSSIYALLARDEFVRPVKLSARSIGFLAEEVDDWIIARGEDRDRPFSPG